jgi:hypothetical protein
MLWSCGLAKAFVPSVQAIALAGMQNGPRAKRGAVLIQEEFFLFAR